MMIQIPAHYFRYVRMAVAAELYCDLDTATARVVDQGLDALQSGRPLRESITSDVFVDDGLRWSDLIGLEAGDPPRVEAGAATTTVSVRPTPEHESRLRELIEGDDPVYRFTAEEVLAVAFFYGLAQLSRPLCTAVFSMPCEPIWVGEWQDAMGRAARVAGARAARIMSKPSGPKHPRADLDKRSDSGGVTRRSYSANARTSAASEES